MLMMTTTQHNTCPSASNHNLLGAHPYTMATIGRVWISLGKAKDDEDDADCEDDDEDDDEEDDEDREDEVDGDTVHLAAAVVQKDGLEKRR